MKKINIGILLIIFVVIAFVSMCIIDITNKEKEIENVKKFLNEYLEIYSKYAMLEKENRNIDNNISQVEYTNYLSKMKSEIDKYVLESRKDYIFDMYKERLDNQYKGIIMYNEFQVDNYEYEETDVNGDIICIKLRYNLKVSVNKRMYPTFDIKSNRYIGIVKQFTGIMQPSDLIVIKKIKNNEYKIVYHDVKAYIEFPFEKNDVFLGI